MICAQFVFKPGTDDDDFHRLDDQIDEFARGLPGFSQDRDVDRARDRRSQRHLLLRRRDVPDPTRPLSDAPRAKGQVARWYDGYRIVISEVRATYGDDRLPD